MAPHFAITVCTPTASLAAVAAGRSLRSIQPPLLLPCLAQPRILGGFSGLRANSFREGAAALPSCASRRLVAAAATSMGSAGVKSIPATEAEKLVSSGDHTYLDVRTPEEFAAGHAPGAINIPIMLSGPAGFSKVPDFVQQVEGRFPQDAALVVGCKAGGRSRQAVLELQDAGYTNLLDVSGGFLSWEQSGLPITK